MDNNNIIGTPGRSSGPRLYHKKSRTGCITCKRRRVKCDEKCPSCTGCSRHGAHCAYPNSAPVSTRQESTSPGASSSSYAAGRQTPGLELPPPPPAAAEARQGGPSPLSGSASTVSTTQGHTPESFRAKTPSTAAAVESSYATTSFYYPPFRPPTSTTAPTPDADPHSSSIPDPPESRHRRLWELRLLHNYIEILHSSREPSANPPVVFPWTREIPLLAFQDSAILYAILAQSALNLWTQATHPQEREDMRTLQTTYLAMALREQRAAVAGLTRATADRVCMASLTILHHAYALVQTTVEDEHGQWQPPLEWLRVGRGTGRVWTVAQGLLKQRRTEAGAQDDAAQAKILAFLSSPPAFDMDEIFTEANRQPYLWLLEDPEPRDEDDNELEDQVTRWVYHNALSYVGWTAQAADAGDAEFAVQRRLAAFAVWMSDLFEEFCQQRRPRALVVLAWFFRLWIPYRHRWEVNGVGERMVRGIHGVLEERWRGKLEPIYREYGL
ncbi:hypothetical protein BR93DRAFT_509575 [Coniochaeta sp. PMI_546]|nr:hypothetical protein BR93DRAFT_509575 [Coniochaeta sp. PMI_546]